MKQHVLLAKTEHSGAQFRELVKGYVKTFKDNQSNESIFRGIRQTYQAKEGFLDEPSKRGFRPVRNTVPEYLEYLEKTSNEYVSNLFALEATNASGTATARLVVDGEDFGELTTLELLRLKSFLDHQELNTLYQSLPVRPDNQMWKESDDEEFRGKPVWATQLFENPHRTTLKEPFILKDPNIEFVKDGKGYQPQVQYRDTPIIMGEQQVQWFSGEISHRERADILERLTKLKGAVKEALAKANEVEIVPSPLTGQKVFGYLRTGKVA